MCTPERVRAYRARLSGPLLDRLDVHVALPPVSVTALHRGSRGEDTATVRERVQTARALQTDRRARREVAGPTNAALSSRDVERVARICSVSEMLLTTAVTRLGLSARAYGKVLRVARTIADLGGKDQVLPEHVAEAVSLRLLDRGVHAGAAAA